MSAKGPSLVREVAMLPARTWPMPGRVSSGGLAGRVDVDQRGLTDAGECGLALPGHDDLVLVAGAEGEVDGGEVGRRR